MAITRDQVFHVARLARLELTDDEVERLTGELGEILDAVSKVAELDLADVPPTSHPLDLVNAWAEDEPHDVAPAGGRPSQRARLGGRPVPRAADHVSNARHRLAFAGETMFPARASFFWRAWGTSRFPTPLPAHGPTEVGP